eukprot:Pgem_evm1s19445
MKTSLWIFLKNLRYITQFKFKNPTNKFKIWSDISCKVPHYLQLGCNPPDWLKEVIVSFPLKEKEQNIDKIDKIGISEEKLKIIDLVYFFHRVKWSFNNKDNHEIVYYNNKKITTVKKLTIMENYTYFHNRFDRFFLSENIKLTYKKLSLNTENENIIMESWERVQQWK